MDPTSWVDQLFTYGPYAVLALFVLWVAPRQIRVFLECKPTDKVSRYLCGGVAAGCWVVVALMIWFIYANWPPKKVYLGCLGKHGEETTFVTGDKNFYISTKDVSGGRLQWNFAIVTEAAKFEPEQCYEFTLLWKNQYMDYSVKADLLRKGPLYLCADRTDPICLLYDHDRDPNTPNIKYPPISSIQAVRAPPGGWMMAYAQDRSDGELIRALCSHNEHFRAQARSQLRRLPDARLQNLLRMRDLPQVARDQIQAELQRRRR